MTSERDLDQFYTNNDIALKCYDLLQDILTQHNIKPTIWLEPSAGSGAFFSIVSGSKLGIDIDPKIEKVVKADFLEYPLQDEGYITIGNPPFGKNSSLAIKFFNKCAEVSKVVAFIVPKTFKKDSVQKKLNKHMHLAFEWDVPSNSFNIKKEVRRGLSSDFSFRVSVFVLFPLCVPSAGKGRVEAVILRAVANAEGLVGVAAGDIVGLFC